MTNLPFGMSGNTPAPEPAKTGLAAQPFGMSGVSSNGTPASELFGTSKTVDVDSITAHMPKARKFPMPIIPTRFEPSFGRWGHYMLPDVEGQKPHAFYTRVTTIGKSLEDTEFLERWSTAKLMEGLAKPENRHILDHVDVEALQRGDHDARETVMKLVDAAKEAAGAKNASEFGNAVHAWSEAVDLDVCELDDVPEDLRAHVAAYVYACRAEGIVPVAEYVERIVFNPYTRAAGRIDRISRMPDGTLVILDVKTAGNINSGLLSIGVQLAQYATGQYLLKEDGSGWDPMPPVDQNRAIIAHVPSTPDESAGGVYCDLIEVDLQKGIETMMLSTNVRNARSTKKALSRGVIRRAMSTDTHLGNRPIPQVVPAVATTAVVGASPSVAPPVPVVVDEFANDPVGKQVWEAVRVASTVEEMSAVFQQFSAVWEDRFTAWGMAHLKTKGAI